MPFQYVSGQPGRGNMRANVQERLTDTEIDALSKNLDLDTLQFECPPPADTWARLERLLFSTREDVALRVYGYQGTKCDLAFLHQVPSLRRFAADCLQSTSNLAALEALPRLRELTIEVSDLTDFGVLHRVAPGLTRLTLGETRSKRPTLEPLPRFSQLETLHIEGHGKRLELLAHLPKLTRLTARRLRSPDFRPLSVIPTLQELDVTLGSATDLSSIKTLRALKSLTLSWVRGLADVTFLGDCTSLQLLVLDRLRNISALPDLRALTHLRLARLINMKGLTNVDGLASAPALESVTVTGSPMSATDAAQLLRAPSLKEARVFLLRAHQADFERQAAKAGIATKVRSQPPFVLR